jgi:hypothetical protein
MRQAWLKNPSGAEKRLLSVRRNLNAMKDYTSCLLVRLQLLGFVRCCQQVQQYRNVKDHWSLGLGWPIVA